jgi:hypothetical protein
MHKMVKLGNFSRVPMGLERGKAKGKKTGEKLARKLGKIGTEGFFERGTIRSEGAKKETGRNPIGFRPVGKGRTVTG